MRVSVRIRKRSRGIRSTTTIMWPVDSIIEKPANGHFLRDLLIFNGLNSGGFASKGFIFEPPDFNNAQIGELNEFQDQLSVLLASLSDNQRLQVQWFCDSDYQRALLRYNEETKRATNTWRWPPSCKVSVARRIM